VFQKFVEGLMSQAGEFLNHDAGAVGAPFPRRRSSIDAGASHSKVST
jgi:hypothetical protein